jgi:CxxC motif-containing protein (DUF1111 family)
MRRRVVPAVLAAVAVIGSVAIAVAADSDPVIGTWQLNAAKSTFTSGPAPKSQTRTYSQSGPNITLVMKTVGPDGKEGTTQTTYQMDGVHDLFTIQGRTDVSNPPNNCTLAQPDFAAEAARGNLSFRIPTPLFGAGLIENLSENTILANLVSSASPTLGIHGVPNRSGNDGSITRFGWKAQNKSLLIFAGEAYNVEVGVTNELFPDERGYSPNPIPVTCLLNPTPEDLTVFDPSLSLSDVAAFAVFMRFLDQPASACGTGTGIDCTQAAAGKVVFMQIGCGNCHTPSLTTTASEFAPASLSGVQANLFSDLGLHHMGTRLAHGITQGNAGPDQFRTSPLWGVGQRVFFLHDGRTANLAQAILEHQSPGSEANQVVQNFQGLSLQDMTSLIVFLRSL